MVDLVRRFVLLDDETIEWQKDFPDGPAVDLETSDRVFSVKVVRDWLRVDREPWVAGVVVASREDQEVEGPPSRDVFLVLADGSAVHLTDQAAMAALGTRVGRGELDAVAYAELLVEGGWPGGWSKRVIVDPGAWRAGYPAEAALPPVEPFAATPVESGGVRLAFFTSREQTRVVGGRAVVDVAQWSVLAPSDAPATWQRHAVADEVPVEPPW
jgi:hypothetical protein